MMSSFSVFLRSFIAIYVYLPFVPGAHSHNFVSCTNSKPNLTALLTEPLAPYDGKADHCDGYPRGLPDANSVQGQDTAIGNQGYPWQFLWPMQDAHVLQTHRACNWNQELPFYDSNRAMASVRPGATIMLKVATNGHAHEYETVRAAGHHKVYLAGDGGTHITTSNQLTDDRVIFMAPMTKYAHLVGTGGGIAQGVGDPGYAWLPLKLVDPAGNALRAGVYNMVFTWWWPSDDGKGSHIDFMLPAYSTCFDIHITENSKDAGFLTDLVSQDKTAHITLIGNNTSPGSKDHTSPWPPYPPGYLTTNYDGDDPALPASKRAFQPYFTKHIDAVKMPEPQTHEIYPIAAWTAAQLAQTIVSPPGSDDDAFWPLNTTIVGNMTMRGTDPFQPTAALAGKPPPATTTTTPMPMTVNQGLGFGGTVFYPNDTVLDPYLRPGFQYADAVETPSAVPTVVSSVQQQRRRMRRRMGVGWSSS